VIRNKQILVAVLNWGLGHATRSIPIIRDLLAAGNKVAIASDGAALSLLIDEFPKVESFELPSYNITYPSSSMIWNIGTQFPKISKAIRTEQQTINNWIKRNNIDIIISDNRYGCYHASTENIFISHQINLQVPFGRIINRFHALMINRFNEIWIVDEQTRKLSGKLTDSKWISTNTKIKYIGPKSRLKKVPFEKKYDIAAILSGPEPQRTFLEKELIEKMSRMNLNSILIQGSKTAPRIESSKYLKVLPFANEELLSQIICSTEMLVCRSGYSTIMDLAKLGGHALFVPTPGQTEQIYLAKRLANQGLVQYQNQGKVDIQNAWSQRNTCIGF